MPMALTAAMVTIPMAATTGAKALETPGALATKMGNVAIASRRLLIPPPMLTNLAELSVRTALVSSLVMLTASRELHRREESCFAEDRGGRG